MILKASTAELSSSPLAHVGFYQLQNQSELYFKLNTGTQGNVMPFELRAEICFTELCIHTSPALSYQGFHWLLLVQVKIFLLHIHDNPVI